MEHLYRMVFAIARIYLDRSQSAVYLEAARKQLRWARKHMEIERSLCACSDHAYTARLPGIIQDRGPAKGGAGQCRCAALDRIFHQECQPTACCQLPRQTF